MRSAKSGVHAESKDPQSSNDLLAVCRHSPRDAGNVTSSCRRAEHARLRSIRVCGLAIPERVHQLPALPRINWHSSPPVRTTLCRSSRSWVAYPALEVAWDRHSTAKVVLNVTLSLQPGARVRS